MKKQNQSDINKKPRQPARYRASTACKRHLAVVEARIATMTDAEIFAEAEAAMRDLGF